MSGAGQCHLRTGLNADAEAAHQHVPILGCHLGHPIGNIRQPARRRQGVPVRHRPEPTVVVAKRFAQVRQAVDLGRFALSDRVPDRHQPVAVDRAGATGDGARRPLCPIRGVAGHPTLGGDVLVDHLEQVELRGHLEKRALVLRVGVQLGHVGDNLAHRERPWPPGRRCPQLGQGRRRQAAIRQRPPVCQRSEHISVDDELRTHLIASGLPEANQVVEPAVPRCQVGLLSLRLSPC